ncbi:AgmX/PglI C-terminal domain-containing protein [Marinibactrum halimedae]|uniref:AgmX/PglI C-terminal domain-containing protein n=1 Tax=Marinibactrum halimedae TaxID=1444977 RepID=A0AA37TBI8_9GAMM|nr:AgmX/PglI C-terminal domain-containing protein [Marinibactrum halimedae]MCD9458273.1 AgmX/PglI C-terminal domain-containing protein [Marinibactrum halimedae]GLS27100.1 hypothetical protein GCM10007877_28190 [Marinibactrum halimedae]
MSVAFNTAMLNLELPWQSGHKENSRFKKIATIMLAVLFVVGVVIPMIPIPEKTREEKETLPPELARVVLEKKEIPKPEPKKEEKKPEPKKEEKKPEPKKEEPKKEPEKIVDKKPEPAPTVEKAREKAATSGLLQFQDDLADMREAMDSSKLSSSSLSRGESQAKQLDRSVITNKAKQSSGGINTAALSRDTGGVRLSGKENTTVSSELADAQGKNPVSAGKGKARSGRGDQDIRAVMDRNKGAIFAIYNRELRKDPSLEGKVVVKMVIEPNGSISDIQIVSSELNNPALEKKLLARIRLINFGSRDVNQTTVNYTLSFFPA